MCTRTFCEYLPPPIGQLHRLLCVFFAPLSFLFHKTGGFGGPAGGPYIVHRPTVHSARVRARNNITALHRSVSSRQKRINTRPIMMIRERVPTSRAMCVNILNEEHKKKSSSLFSCSNWPAGLPLSTVTGFLLGWVIFNNCQGDRQSILIGGPYDSPFTPFFLPCNQQMENQTKLTWKNGFAITTTVRVKREERKNAGKVTTI